MRLKDYLGVAYVFGTHTDGRVDVCFEQQELATLPPAQAEKVIGLINEKCLTIEFLLRELQQHDPEAWKKTAEFVERHEIHRALIDGDAG